MVLYFRCFIVEEERRGEGRFRQCFIVVEERRGIVIIVA